jgi:indoleamine 2,3-dioxygenase
LVYADDILSNWIDSEPSESTNYSNLPAVETLRARTLFTGTTDEENFYVTPARIELRGVELLKLMQTIFADATCVDTDAGAIQQITNSLMKFSTIISELRTLFLARHEKVNPDYFYKQIRPWLIGDSSETPEGKWVFEGIERDPTLRPPTELFGSSGAQCSLIQSLDIFLGVDNYADNSTTTSFIQRVRLYMPRRHRAFLEHLSELAVTRSLRELVRTANDKALLEAYNDAVRALKEFRDAHMIVVALFVIGPARRLARADAEAAGANGYHKSAGTEENMKGTAGGDLARLLKGFRDRTTGAVMAFPSGSSS